MTFVDASALLALLLDEPGAPDVEGLLREGGVAMTSVNYAEVIDQALRVQRKSRAAVARALDPLTSIRALVISDVSAATGVRAGELRATHYDRRDRPLSMADCILLAAASFDVAAVATSDQLVADVACRVGLPVRGLPNSLGVRPTTL